jgi:hypothetical protein
MIERVADTLLDTGLLQLGRFERQGKPEPLRLSLEMLSAYPDTLKLFVEAAQAVVSCETSDRILVPSSAIAFGGAISLLSERPLIYSRGYGEEPVYDLVGAYNAGHSAILISPTETDITAGLIAAVSRVGIVITCSVLLVSMYGKSHHQMVTKPLYDLDTLIMDLGSRGRVPARQAKLVLDWLRNG